MPIRSKIEAQLAGWIFTNAAPAEVVTTSSTQGSSRIKPAQFTAEKYQSVPGKTSQRVEETAESEEQLVKQISAYEDFRVSVGAAPKVKFQTIAEAMNKEA